MKEFLINKTTKDNRYNSLKNDLFNNSISFNEVRDKLVEWDQEDYSRKASDENLLFLYDSQFTKYLKQYPEMLEGYNRFLSFTEFHVAQRLAQNDPQKAIEHFKKAFDLAQENQENESWQAYTEGTLTYMGGKEIPRIIIQKVTQPKNKKILENLNNGLKERGTPLYIEDYNKK